eukprot:jgi/Galph1/1875/GphlegSOOS_G561.1
MNTGTRRKLSISGTRSSTLEEVVTNSDNGANEHLSSSHLTTFSKRTWLAEFFRPGRSFLLLFFLLLFFVSTYIVVLSSDIFKSRRARSAFTSEDDKSSSLFFNHGRHRSSDIFSDTETNLLSQFRFVTISSDDWGRFADSVPLFPDKLFKEQNLDIVNSKGTPWEYGTVETKSDLLRLQSLLEELNQDVPNHRRIVMTPFWIVSGPNIVEMSNAGCPLDPICTYKEVALYDGGGGLARAPYSRGDLRPLYMELFGRRLWHPEYHGRSHFDIFKWLSDIRTVNSTAYKCFQRGLVCGNSYSSLRSEHSMFSSIGDEESQVIAYIQWLSVGLHSFRRFWGYTPKVISSPHNIWSPTFLQSVGESGFIGAELGDDQARWLRSHNTHSHLSLMDRFRYDAFYSEFDLTTRLASLIHHLNETFFTSLLWHAQNSLSSCYDGQFSNYLSNTFLETIRKLREIHSFTVVFLTSSEFHQIRRRGWSREIWPDRLVYRNFLTKSISINIDNLGLFIRTDSNWSSSLLEVSFFSYLNDSLSHLSLLGGLHAPQEVLGNEKLYIHVDDTLLLPPGCYIEVLISNDNQL